jgi:hypothetical protein
MKRMSFFIVVSTLLALSLMFALVFYQPPAPQVINPAIVDLNSLEYIVPSANLPADIVVNTANNNLDAVTHNDREYLAFRTASTHWPNGDSKIFVVYRGAGEKSWSKALEFSNGSDLREPRLLSWNNQLFLYFAVLSEKFASFDPQYTLGMKLLTDSSWTEPTRVFKDTLIPWRTKVIDNKPYMSSYTWDESLLRSGVDPTTVYLLTTDDGMNWQPVDPSNPTIKNASSETDFAMVNTSTSASSSAISLFGISRNEFPDEMDWGSKICQSMGDSLVDWRCVYTPKKYDSPLLFSYKENIYLVARRNLNKTGDYNLGISWLPKQAQTIVYELMYWLTPKRCSLWQLNKTNLEISFLTDLSSKGDTCFPAMTQSNDELYLYNYTSPPDGPELSWLRGQLGKTSIYRVKITLD